MDEHLEKKNLSGGQKTGFVLLLLFALLTVGLTFLQLRNTIYSPFVVHISKDELQAKESLEFDENVRLQQIDTDRDNLNDYEELYFYETSPYLADTDSDGIEDKVEIDQGTNPLCPEGTACDMGEFDVINNSSTLASPLLSGVDSSSQILVKSQFENDSTSSTINLTELLKDPVALRKMLIATGQVTEEDLKNIDDETLIKAAQNIAENKFDLNVDKNTSQSSSSTQSAP